MDYSFVIPVYNEEKIIAESVDKLYDFLRKTKKAFEIIIANDGSNDKTLEIAMKKSRQYKEVKIISNEQNRGRGSVLTKGFKMIKGRFGFYIDSDLSIDLSLFYCFIKELDSGADIVIGSKHLIDSEVEYSFVRRLVSRGYSTLAQRLFKIPIKDYQCGFKAFRKSVLDDVLNSVKNQGWFWDTEILIRSHLNGWKIREIPALVKESSERISKVRLISDILSMFFSMVKFKLEIKKKL